MKNKRISSVVIFFSLIFMINAESEGKKLFLMNEPEKAIPLLEQEIAGTVSEPDIYNYLGIAYYQIGEYDKSVEVFEKALNVDGTDKKIIAFNAGNSAFAAGNYTAAQQYYSLAIAADAAFSKPVLNRANCYLKQGDLQNSLSDYENFLFIAPDDKQHDKVEQLVALLKSEIQKQKDDAVKAEEEAARVKQEQEKIAAAQAEQAKVAAAQKEEAEKAAAAQQAAAEEKAAAEAQAAAERRRKLLEEAASSLQESNTTDMTAGPESVQPQEDELELD